MLMPSIFGENLFDDFFGLLYLLFMTDLITEKNLKMIDIVFY